ncbi:hypothetical protein ACFRR7_21200 [Streptomyces sp. NPDC056909]|uniref:hypothetical protein n=1 Tax=Streptomyces sp. NPDC056909 TaxID=3345963 RepID=UPI0036CB9DD2
MQLFGGRSKLQAVDNMFGCIEEGVHPLFLDGADIGGILPRRQVSLRELRELSVARLLNDDVSEIVWAELVFKAQCDGGDWVVGAMWMMAPALRAAVRKISVRGSASKADIESDVIEGFLAELKRIDIEQGKTPQRLWWSAYRRGLACSSEYWRRACEVPSTDRMMLHAHRSLSQHPDAALYRAVVDQVITMEEAEIIAATRIEKQSLVETAGRLRLSYARCLNMRRQAEQRLAVHLALLPVQGSARR